MILMTLFLATEGWVLAHRILRRSYGSVLEVCIGLPLGALINLLAIAILTLCNIPLSALSIPASNMIVLCFLLFSVQPFKKTECSSYTSQDTPIKVPRYLTTVSVCILASSLLYAVSHSLLPTFHYDSTTNWNMRSQVSFYQSQIVFDDMDGLVGKPNYPFLYHALQISINSFSPKWSDLSANAIHLLLMLSSIGTLFLLLSHRGRSYALTVLALIIGMPLLTLHTGQSYADITLVMYAMLSLGFLLEYRRTEDVRTLLLSGLFLCATVWTKADGIFFCYIPWIIVMSFILVRKAGSIGNLRYPVAYSMFLSLTWPLFAAVKNVSMTPHGSSDTEIALQTEAVFALSKSLFVSGSFGIYWYALLAALVFVGVGISKNTIEIDKRYLITMLWGLIALAGYMAVYLFTSNTEYLILGQSFDRQMLLPASLLTLSLSYLLIPRRL